MLHKIFGMVNVNSFKVTETISKIKSQIELKRTSGLALSPDKHQVVG